MRENTKICPRCKKEFQRIIEIKNEHCVPCCHEIIIEEIDKEEICVWEQTEDGHGYQTCKDIWYDEFEDFCTYCGGKIKIKGDKL